MSTATELHNNIIRLNVLAAGLLNAKDREAKAKEERIAIEEEIAAIVGVKDEGSYTYKSDLFKFTTTGKVSRKLDPQKYEQIKERIPEKLRPVIYKPEIKQSLIKYLQNNEPDYYKVMTECMTTTQNKASVVITPID